MEQQAKERLTGGVILVLLLVLLVPELLTGPRPLPQSAPAPPDQAPMRSYTMDLGDSPHANSAPVAASTAVPPASEPAAPTVSASASQPIAALPEATPEVAAPPAPHAAVVASVPHAAEHVVAAWTVQLATFGKRENASRLVAQVKAHGFSATISEATKNGRTLFRVRVGNERTQVAAQKLLARLKAAGEKGGEVVLR